MHHWGEHERELSLAQVYGVAVFHFHLMVGHAIETFHHAERFLVADNLNVGIILLDECDGPAVVRLHVVDDQVVDGTVTDYFVNVLQKLGEEVHFHGVYQGHLVVDHEIRVV